MKNLPDRITPEIWLRQVLGSCDAKRGGIVKRQVRDVERIVGRDVFLAEVERRGWQALENGAHFIVCCNAEPIRRVRPTPARAGV